MIKKAELIYEEYFTLDGVAKFIMNKINNYELSNT